MKVSSPLIDTAVSQNQTPQTKEVDLKTTDDQQTTSPATTSATPNKREWEMSATLKQFIALNEQSKQVPDVDLDKVALVKAKLAEGTLGIFGQAGDAKTAFERISDKLIEQETALDTLNQETR